jgi:hypothetical protein
MVDYKYPFHFRFLHLWMPYIIIGGSIPIHLAVHYWKLNTPIVAIVIGYLLLLYLSERWLYRKIPTGFRLEGNTISLARLREYSRFSVDDVESVQTGVYLPFTGWTRVQLKSGISPGVFYIAPSTEFYSSLIELLTRERNDQRIRKFAAFEWPAHIIWIRRLVAVVFAAGALMIALNVLLDYNTLSVSDMVFMSIIGLGWAWLVWLHSLKMPVYIEFNDKQILFEMLFGSKLRVSRSDIVSVYRGVKMGPFRINGSKGATVRLRRGPRLFVEASFIGYPELYSRLNSLAA